MSPRRNAISLPARIGGGTAGNPLHHFRRVAAEVVLYQLEHTVGVLQRGIVPGGRLDQLLNDVVERLPRFRLVLRLLPARRGVLFSSPRLTEFVSHTLVLPRVRLILSQEAVVVPSRLVPLVLHQPGKDAVQLFSAFEVGAHDRRGIGVVEQVLLEEGVRLPALVVDDVVDESAQERDIAARANRGVEITHGAGAGEARVDVDQLRPVFHLRLHRPAERHRVALRHVAALEDDAVREREIARVGGRRAASEPGPQTGDARGVSYSGLVFDRHHPQAAHELLLHVVPLVVQSGATQRENGGGLIDQGAVLQSLHKGFIARLLDQLGNPVHGPVQLDLLPIDSTRLPVEDPGCPVGILDQLVSRGSLGTEAALVVRAPLVALDVDDLIADRMGDHRAADRAVGTDGGSGFGFLDTDLLSPHRGRNQGGAQSYERAEGGAWAKGCCGSTEKLAAGERHGSESGELQDAAVMWITMRSVPPTPVSRSWNRLKHLVEETHSPPLRVPAAKPPIIGLAGSKGNPAALCMYLLRKCPAMPRYPIVPFTGLALFGLLGTTLMGFGPSGSSRSELTPAPLPVPTAT